MLLFNCNAPFVYLVKGSVRSGKTPHCTNTIANQIVLGGQRRQQLQYPMHVQSINTIALRFRKANRLQPHKLLNRLWTPHTNSFTLGRAGYWVQDLLLSSKYTIHTPIWIGVFPPISICTPIRVGVFIFED